MKETDYINAYAMALAQFNLNQIQNEFEPVKPPEDDDYKRGFLDGWVKCTDYFIKHELNKEG